MWQCHAIERRVDNRVTTRGYSAFLRYVWGTTCYIWGTTARVVAIQWHPCDVLGVLVVLYNGNVRRCTRVPLDCSWVICYSLIAPLKYLIAPLKYLMLNRQQSHYLRVTCPATYGIDRDIFSQRPYQPSPPYAKCTARGTWQELPDESCPKWSLPGNAPYQNLNV
jgi:hypothetical protein